MNNVYRCVMIGGRPWYHYLMQSVPIITKIVGLTPADGEVYSIQHYVIEFVSDL